MPTVREYEDHIALQDKLIAVQGKVIDALTRQVTDLMK